MGYTPQGKMKIAQCHQCGARVATGIASSGPHHCLSHPPKVCARCVEQANSTDPRSSRVSPTARTTAEKNFSAALEEKIRRLGEIERGYIAVPKPVLVALLRAVGGSISFDRVELIMKLEDEFPLINEYRTQWPDRYTISLQEEPE